MKLLKVVIPTIALCMTAVTGALAEETVYTKGVVKKVKPEDGKVTIIHEELVELDMPAMTMVFRVADDAMFEELEPGEEIEFSVDRIDGKLTVTDVK